MLNAYVPGIGLSTLHLISYSTHPTLWWGVISILKKSYKELKTLSDMTKDSQPVMAKPGLEPRTKGFMTL